MKRRKKVFTWALYENLCRIERDEAFHLLKWAVDSSKRLSCNVYGAPWLKKQQELIKVVKVRILGLLKF